MIKKIKGLLIYLFFRVFLNSDEKLLIKKLKSITPKQKKQKMKKEEFRILLQMPEDYFFLIKFYLFYLILKEEYSVVNVGLVQLSDSQLRKTKISKIQNSFLYDLKWRKIYKSLFKGEVVFNYNFASAQIRNGDKEEAEKIFSSFKTKDDVLASKYKQYKIGILVYNYYLRVTNSPTIDINSTVLFELILNTIRSLNELEKIFQEKKYNIFLTSYITYTVHGVPALVALENNSRVFAFSGLDQFYLEVFPSFFTHVKNYLKYKELKGSLSEANLHIAQEKIEQRLSGVIDVSTSYMSKSSYSYRNDIFKFDSRKESVVIYLHCFFDSPHIYRNMLFSDFYEWLEFTLRTLSKNAELEIYIKKHPGAIAGNDHVVEKILSSFPSVKVIPHDFNNIQIANEVRPKAILTVYGTVAHEMAYLGIPVICAGDNPHIDFEFHETPSLISDYEKILLNIHAIKSYSLDEVKAVKKEVLRFFYLHNCYSFLEKLNEEEQDEYNVLLKLFRSGNLKEFVQNFKRDDLDKLLKKIRLQYFQEIK